MRVVVRNTASVSRFASKRLHVTSVQGQPTAAKSFDPQSVQPHPPNHQGGSPVQLCLHNPNSDSIPPSPSPSFTSSLSAAAAGKRDRTSSSIAIKQNNPHRPEKTQSWEDWLDRWLDRWDFELFPQGPYTLSPTGQHVFPREVAITREPVGDTEKPNTRDKLRGVWKAWAEVESTKNEAVVRFGDHNPAMSDEDYQKFLDGTSARSDNAAAESAGHKSRKGGFTTNSVDSEVPSHLEGIDATYTSDADEPFEPVSLKCDGGEGKVDLQLFEKVTSHSDVSGLDVGDFDPRDEYKSLLEKVKRAGNGEVAVFRVELGGARCEYWIVSLDRDGRRMVGLRAGSVES